ncbi:MAG: peptidylprolyl isomerase [Patescibacteria group bacterium]
MAKDNEVKISTIVYSSLIVAVAIIVVFGILIYGFGKDYKAVKKMEKIIPYPVAVLNNYNFITFKNLNNNLESVKKFYENQDFSKVDLRVDFSTENGKKRLKMKEKEVLERMIEDKAIEILARKEGMKITDAMVSQNLSRKMEEYGTGDNLNNNLEKLYGWSIDDFKEKVVKPDLYRQELEKIFASRDSSVKKGKEQIEKAKAELNKKKVFADVAMEYSKGSTAQDGGELGWFKKDQLIEEVSKAVFASDKGKISDIIESSLGFHIIEVEDKKTENDSELIRIRQIFLPKKTFGEFLYEEMKKMKIMVFSKDYSWNKEEETVDFKDEPMKNFEKEIINNSQGDASVLF